MLQFKALSLALGLGLGLASTPAQAGSVDRVSFDIPARVKAQLVSHTPGVARYRVASNAGFTVRVKGVVGDVSVDLEEVGPAAQMPGAATQDNFVTRCGTVVYRAVRKTALRPASRRQQSVIVEITYSKLADAEFDFVPSATTR